MDCIFRVGEFELPADIMHVVMSNFAIEELFAFRLVSKNWNRSIRDREFMLYYNKFCQKNKERHIIICDFGRHIGPHRAFVSISSEYMNKEQWDTLLPLYGCSNDIKFDVIGSIDGLICLESENYNKMPIWIIYNPVIGQKIEVSPPDSRGQISKCNFCHYTIHFVLFLSCLFIINEYVIY